MTTPDEGRRSLDCRLLPHGGYTLFPAVLSTMAWLASLAQDGCDYAKLTGPIVEDMTGSSAIPYLEVGFNAYREPIKNPNDGSWNVDYTSRCQAYPSDVVDVDGYWNVAKGFAFLSLVLGGGGALFLWFSSCFVFSPGTWRWAGYEILAATVLQCFAFLWFRTDMCHGEGDKCDLFFGSKSDIVAACFWFASAVFIFVRYPTPVPKEGDTRSGHQAADVETAEEGNASEELELPVEGSSGRTLPAPADDPGAVSDDPNAKVPDAEIS